MKIGVIGANGFIGRSLCRKYLEEDHEVFAFYNQNKASIPSGCQLFSIQNIPDVRLDNLIISIGGHGLKHQDYLYQYSFLENILHKINFNKLIFISSVDVYGKNKDKISPTSAFMQPSMYGQSKLAQEFLVKSFENHLIIRPTYIYGPGMNQNSLIPIWSKFAKEKNEIIIFGDGKRKQDYLFISDLTELCVLATKSNKHSDIIIAATGTSVSNHELAMAIAQNIPNTVINFRGEDKAHSLKYDISDSKNKYGWNPKIFIKEGILNYLKNESTNI